MIKIEALSKSYSGKEVLNNINLTVEAGKVIGIVGENGSGKTTLFKCIAGLEPYNGKVSSAIKPLKDTLGFLQTDPFFFPKITGREYLQLLCNARKIKNVNFDARNLFSLPLQQYASTYSTGMKKKLALTGILLQNNKYFILDEPFNGVDIQSNMMITEIIQKLRQLEKTILISSHIFSTLKDTCDEIQLLKEGAFQKRVSRDEFDLLEQEMKDSSIGSSIDRLELQ